MRYGAGCLVVLFALTASPSDAAADQDSLALLTTGVKALHEGHADDAIASLEALADLGVVDPVASFDRGLAYSLRVRAGGEVPGDLGRAVHGFEEARDLSRSRALKDEASRALSIVRSEIVRRRLRAGESIETEPGRSLMRTITDLLGENAWANSAIGASLMMSLGLFVHWLARARRARIAGNIASGIAALTLLVSLVMTLAARHDRWLLREAVVVVDSARPTDERGLALASATSIPEGARVEVIGQPGALVRVRYGRVDAWLSSRSVRELAPPQ
jgi:hypothetical protein